MKADKHVMTNKKMFSQVFFGRLASSINLPKKGFLINGSALSGQPFVFLHQLLLAFFVIGVGDAAVHRTDSGALRGIEMAHALRALLGVDDINFISDRDGLVWAFGFAGSAVDTLFCDLVSHVTPPG
jgi:hypothetical protein